MLVNHCFVKIGLGDLAMALKMLIFMIFIAVPCMVMCIGFFVMGDDEIPVKEQ